MSASPSPTRRPAAGQMQINLTEMEHSFILHGASDPAGYYTRIAELPYWSAQGYGQTKKMARDRGALIVRAVNNHASLLAALEAARDAMAEALPQAEGCFHHHYGDNPEGGPTPTHIVDMQRALAQIDAALERARG